MRSRSGLLAICHASEAEYRLGAWDESLTHAQLAVALATESSDARILAYAHSLATWVPAARGDWSRAQAHAGAARRAARRLGDEASSVFAATAAAQVAACRGRPGAVVDVLEPITTLPAWMRGGEQLWAAYELYADALVSIGRLLEAEAALSGWEPAVDTPGLLVAAGARRVRARLEAAQGRSEDAVEHFEAALDQARAHPRSWALALTHDSYGRLLRRRGERRAAADQLHVARAAFEDLGARPFFERSNQELAACGLTPAPRSNRDDRALTPQEAAVARLVATGLTNRAVALELVLSVKTVEYHLGHVYAKLDVASRSQLAARFGGQLRADGSGHRPRSGAITLPMEAES
ncbi:MAG: helix-turn-helix transcriptional regulator [Actinomycetota bacterium]|nr:helix-turn-helix transcriptional regulator [Actinomycetota bacterium]